jgi:predicted lipid-binding transport protein (Tim44 family)
VTSPCKDKGSNPATLLYDARGPDLERTVGTAPDIGAFEVQGVLAPPTISTVQVNDGAAQRSLVKSLQVTFSEPVTFTNNVPQGKESPVRLAKMIFIRMQAANDTGDLNDLRTFTTPEMFAVVKLELQDRGAAKQTTDVVKVDAEVLDLEQQGERQVVSVRFHGQIREDLDAAPSDFDEIWHLVRWGDNPAWTIAGIQQRQ